MSCGVGCRHGSDPALLWLWRRPAAATSIRPLASELPYAAGMALRRKKKFTREIILDGTVEKFSSLLLGSSG